MQQLLLFDEIQKPLAVKSAKRSGGSSNPIIFRDYESYMAKFQQGCEKTTDDTYTPADVYDAVVDYVRSIYDMTDKEILRPFYPGGDYEHAEYPENGVVIDNPPFSIFTHICKFYTKSGIPFFLFGPGMTIGQVLRFCSVVTIGCNLRFHNGATINCNFATNLLGDVAITSSCSLTERLLACDSQKNKESKTKKRYSYPAEVLSISDFQIMSNGGG